MAILITLDISKYCMILSQSSSLELLGYEVKANIDLVSRILREINIFEKLMGIFYLFFHLKNIY